jgi:NitT/TauT family transport system ATP-binding protein
MKGIDLQRVSKHFIRAHGLGRITIFQELTLHIEAGKTLAVVGPSGCGKSTLLNIIALLEPIQDGEVLIHGRHVNRADAGTLSMGYLFQRDALLPWRTAMDNALLGVECQRRITNDVGRRAANYFARFGLRGFEHAWPETLSGGQRQRVALIQNLLVDPDILLLDEPFGHLDYQTKLRLEEELLGVIRPEGGDVPEEQLQRKTVIFVTHDIEEAITLGDRVVVLGAPPSGIMLDLPITLDNAMRTPIAARQSDVMKSLFGKIWGMLRDTEHAGSDERRGPGAQ